MVRSLPFLFFSVVVTWRPLMARAMRSRMRRFWHRPSHSRSSRGLVPISCVVKVHFALHRKMRIARTDLMTSIIDRGRPLASSHAEKMLADRSMLTAMPEGTGRTPQNTPTCSCGVVCGGELDTLCTAYL